MTQYHAVLLDETGCEFGHTFEANTSAEAWNYIHEAYPESRCVQLEDPSDEARRRKDIYDRVSREGDVWQWDN